jgi:hypothetical protein
MVSEANNAKFNFLGTADPYHAYYRMRVRAGCSSSGRHRTCGGCSSSSSRCSRAAGGSYLGVRGERLAVSLAVLRQACDGAGSRSQCT